MHSHDPEESLSANETFVLTFRITSSRLAFEWRWKKKKWGPLPECRWGFASVCTHSRWNFYCKSQGFLTLGTAGWDQQNRAESRIWLSQKRVAIKHRKRKKKFSKFKAHRNFLDFVCKTRASYEFFDNLQPLCGTLELSILPFDNRQMTLSDEISRFNSARFLRFLEVFRFYFLGSERWLRHVAMKTRFFGSVSDELASLTTTTCQWLYSIFLLTFLHWLLFSKSFWCTA